MPDEIDNVITQITTLMAAMTGINQAPEHPPESINDPPMVVTYLAPPWGRFDYSAGRGAIGIHTIRCDILLGRGSLSDVEALARPYILRGLEKFAANIKLSSTCEHCLVTSYEGPGRISGYTDETIGVSFILEVKIKHTSITDISV